MKLKESIKRLRKLLEDFNFKVGDRVKVIGRQLEQEGKFGMIEDIAPSGGFYLVNVGGKKGYYHTSDLKFVRREALSQKFNKGAKVKTSEGLTGLVTKTVIEKNKILHWVNNQGPFNEIEISRG